MIVAYFRLIIEFMFDILAERISPGFGVCVLDSQEHGFWDVIRGSYPVTPLVS